MGGLILFVLVIAVIGLVGLIEGLFMVAAVTEIDGSIRWWRLWDGRRRRLRASRPTLMPGSRGRGRWQKLDRAAWRQRGLLDGRTWGDS